MPETPFKFTCAYCAQPTTITDVNYHERAIGINVLEGAHSDFTMTCTSIVCPNPDCGELTLASTLLKDNWAVELGQWVTHQEKINEWQLLPRSKAKPLPNYIPEEVRNNYTEACLILNDSPKASAAMSRRCLQGIIRDFWEIPEKDRGNLGAEINIIKDKIHPDTYASIKAIREIGDIGAHMEKAVDTIVDVDPDEAQLLIELIETLLDDWYVASHKRKKRHEQLGSMVVSKRKDKKASKEASKKVAKPVSE